MIYVPPGERWEFAKMMTEAVVGGLWGAYMLHLLVSGYEEWMRKLIREELDRPAAAPASGDKEPQ